MWDVGTIYRPAAADGSFGAPLEGELVIDGETLPVKQATPLLAWHRQWWLLGNWPTGRNKGKVRQAKCSSHWPGRM